MDMADGAEEPSVGDDLDQDEQPDDEATQTQPPTVVFSQLGATVPADWFYKESLTLLAPDGRANVIASSEPLDEALTLNDYVKAQGDLLKGEFPEYKEYGLEPMTSFGELDGYLRMFSWTPPDGVEVRQMQVYAVSQSRGYTATATVPEQELGRYRARLGTILTLLRLGA